jgi:hypothetical protein
MNVDQKAWARSRDRLMVDEFSRMDTGGPRRSEMRAGRAA